jgi:sugar phosphate isomerase/epimerase
MLLCSSSLRPPDSVGNDAIVRLTAGAGCDGIAIDEGCALGSAPGLARQCLQAGLTVGAVAAPLPEAPLAPGRRLPRLAAPDRDERQAATALAAQALALAGSIGTGVVALRMGPLPLSARTEELVRFFRRRELGEGEDGAAFLAAALDERRARVAPWLDACRWSVDALIREGERRGVALAVELGATPWGLPTPREGLDLMAAYVGARIGVVFDPARLSAMRRLGLPLSAPRLALLRGAALLVADNEAVGVEAGYLPGLGEADEDLASREGIAPSTPVIFVGGADATEDEVLVAASGRRGGA